MLGQVCFGALAFEAARVGLNWENFSPFEGERQRGAFDAQLEGMLMSARTERDSRKSGVGVYGAIFNVLFAPPGAANWDGAPDNCASSIMILLPHPSASYGPLPACARASDGLPRLMPHARSLTGACLVCSRPGAAAPPGVHGDGGGESGLADPALPRHTAWPARTGVRRQRL